MATKNYKLGKFFNLEIQFEWNVRHLEIEWFVFELSTRSYGDHKGGEFRLELLTYLYFCINVYDSRHEDEK